MPAGGGNVCSTSGVWWYVVVMVWDGGGVCGVCSGICGCGVIYCGGNGDM